jgi:2-polyprenyl-3-methyl-5-hydroxy-6-metoxy-1,4-benzoquinol methylase
MAAAASYALDRDGSRGRLELLEAHVDRLSQRRLAGLGVARGWRCLEVAAGLGSVARWLSDRVGSEGRVAVTDLDIRHLQPLAARAPHNIDVWRHDVTTDPLPDDHYDLVHARWLLYHLPDPASVCHRLVQALRPGGTVVIEDVDFFPLAGAHCRAFADAMLAIAAAVGEPVGHGGVWAAQALPRLFEGQPVANVAMSIEVDVLRGGTAIARFWQLTGAQMRPRVKHMAAVEMHTFDHVLEALGDPTFWAISTAHVAIRAQKLGR